MEGEGKNKTKQPMLIVMKPGTEQVIMLSISSIILTQKMLDNFSLLKRNYVTIQYKLASSIV